MPRHIARSEVLAAAEEGLRHKGLAGVVAEVARLGLTASRRLQLAAEESGVPALILRRWRNDCERASDAEATAAVTRWRVSAAPSHPLPVPGVGRERWLVELSAAKALNPAHGCWSPVMRRVVSLFLPMWPTDRYRKNTGDAPPREKPVVMATKIGPRRVIVAADKAAQGLGLRSRRRFPLLGFPRSGPAVEGVRWFLHGLFA